MRALSLLLVTLLLLTHFNADSIKFDFIVTSDTHDAIGGYNIKGYSDWGQFTSFSQQYVAKNPDINVMNLFSGDICEGRQSNDATEEYPYPCQGIIEAMATNGIDTIFTGGNHDIDTLATTEYYMKTFDDPNSFWGDRFVTANIIRKDTGKIYGTSAWTTRMFKTEEGNDFKVAVLGMLDQTWNYMADTVKVISIQEAFNNDEFKSFVDTEKPDLFVILGHYGGHAFNTETNEFLSNPQTYELGNIIRQFAGTNVPMHFLLGHVHVLQSSPCSNDEGGVLDNCWSYCSDGYFEHASIVHLSLENTAADPIFTYQHSRDAFVPTLDNYTKILDTDNFVQTDEGARISSMLAKLNADTEAFKIVGHNTAGHDWIYPTPTNGLGAWDSNSLVRLFFDNVYPALYTKFSKPDLYILNSGTFKENLYTWIDNDQISGIYPYTEYPVIMQVPAESLYYVVHTAFPPEDSEPKDWSDTPAVPGNPVVNKFNYYFTSIPISKLEKGKMYTIAASDFDIGNVLEAACKGMNCGEPTTFKDYELKSLIDAYVVNVLYPLPKTQKTRNIKHSPSRSSSSSNPLCNFPTLRYLCS